MTDLASTYGTIVMAQTEIIAQAERTGPKGEEFGKASPIGLFVILGLLFVVIVLGFLMNKRLRRMERRRAFAEERGIDVFDTEKLEAAMRAEGFADYVGKDTMYARTEVPQTDARFQPSSGIVTGADAIDRDAHSTEKGSGVGSSGVDKDNEAGEPGRDAESRNRETGENPDADGLK